MVKFGDLAFVGRALSEFACYTKMISMSKAVKCTLPRWNRLSLKNPIFFQPWSNFRPYLCRIAISVGGAILNIAQGDPTMMIQPSKIGFGNFWKFAFWTSRHPLTKFITTNRNRRFSNSTDFNAVNCIWWLLQGICNHPLVIAHRRLTTKYNTTTLSRTSGYHHALSWAVVSSIKLNLPLRFCYPLVGDWNRSSFAHLHAKRPYRVYLVHACQCSPLIRPHTLKVSHLRNDSCSFH